MTEQEARTKWCPMVRVYTPNGGANRDNGDAYMQANNRCIASDCMMWRWNNEYTLPNGHVLPDIKLSTTDGCCGEVSHD